MLGDLYLHCQGATPLLFAENETNTAKLVGMPNRTPYVKDSINDYVVNGDSDGRESGKDRYQGLCGL